MNGKEVEKMPPLGMTEDQIRQIERGMPFGESKFNPKYPGVSYLCFRDIVAGLNSRISYFFSWREEAFRIVYLFEAQHGDANLYIADYLKLRTMLIKLYGDPEIERQIWEIDFYRDSPNEFGKAIEYGHMQYRTEWEKRDMLIRLKLRGVNRRIRHELTFVDKRRIQEVNRELRKNDV
jgi:hypothetical protein